MLASSGLFLHYVWMSEITVTQLNVYPIKGCSGIDVDEASLVATGLQHDRQWMVVDENGRFISQRKHPELALVYPHLASGKYGDSILRVNAPEQQGLIIFGAQTKDDSKLVDVTVHDKPAVGQEVSDEASDWF